MFNLADCWEQKNEQLDLGGSRAVACLGAVRDQHLSRRTHGSPRSPQPGSVAFFTFGVAVIGIAVAVLTGIDRQGVPPQSGSSRSQVTSVPACIQVTVSPSATL